MAEKKTYWMADGYGAKALIVGADERDRWRPLGWTETDVPAGIDMVWMRHEEHGGRAKFAAQVMDLWQAKGWKPSDPPPLASPFNAEQPAERAEEPATTTPAPSGKSASDKEK
ncbi:hypothetical protein [Micromonospora humida]|uniref:hypothetical protein n=1 Tax=Micromonospora humida TaxID=2809018 RepID=UPI0034334F3B